MPILLIILLVLVIFSVSDILVRSFQVNMESNRRAAKVVLEDAVSGVNGKIDILSQGLVASPPRQSAEFAAMLEADSGALSTVLDRNAFVFYFDEAWAPVRVVSLGDSTTDSEVGRLFLNLSSLYIGAQENGAEISESSRFATVGGEVFMLSTAARLLPSATDGQLAYMVLGLPAERLLRDELERFEIFRSGSLERILNEADLADRDSIAQVIIELQQQDFEDFRTKTIAQIITVLAAFIIAVVIAHRVDEKNTALEISHEQIAAREQETARMRRIAERASNAKTTLIQNLSHELRTPLNGILGYAELISGEMFGKLPGPLARYREYADNIHTSGSRLMTALSQILEYSDFSGGGVKLRQDPVDLATLFQASVSEFAGSTASKDITVEITIRPEMPQFVGDKNVLAGLMRSLVSNAVAFSNEGGKITLDASTCQYTGGVQIKVADEGAGMEKQKVLELFKPFAQADDVYARENQGLGLGLALAKCYATAHRGVISIETAPGKGTSITVLFRPSEPTVEATPHIDEDGQGFRASA